MSALIIIERDGGERPTKIGKIGEQSPRDDYRAFFLLGPFKSICVSIISFRACNWFDVERDAIKIPKGRRRLKIDLFVRDALRDNCFCQKIARELFVLEGLGVCFVMIL